VAESEVENEYRECLTKAKILSHVKQPVFQIIETILFLPSLDYQLIDLHLMRLNTSAEYFGYPCPLEKIINRLRKDSADWTNPMKIRLLLDASGTFSIETTPVFHTRVKDTVRVSLSASPISSDNIFLYHKTTNRQVYEHAMAAVSGVDDVILYNERDEITEATIANIAVYIDNQWVTPPVSCGLLPGTMRQKLLHKGKINERVITRRELQDAKQITLFNSIRGEYDAILQ
jgi:para-aminobenzoate synthetase/4-amino-4-deoxychorismate lyase